MFTFLALIALPHVLFAIIRNVCNKDQQAYIYCNTWSTNSAYYIGLVLITLVRVVLPPNKETTTHENALEALKEGLKN